MSFPRTPDELLSRSRQQLDEAKRLLSSILEVTGARTVENTFAPYNKLQICLGNAGNLAGLFSEVHPEDKLREAAETSTQEVSAFATALSLNQPLYQALAAVPTGALDPVGARWVRLTLRDFRRAGVDKDEATRERLKALSEEVVKLGQSFDRNIREDVRSVKLPPARLKGLPEDYVKAHRPGPDGLVTITTDYPDYLPFRTYAEDGEARKALYVENLQRAYPVNEPVYRDLLRARREQSRLLGYAHWADYVTEDKMIGSGKAVFDFLEKVSRLAEARGRADYQKLLERKRKDAPDASSVGGWEALFYEEKVKQEQFGFESQSVRPYFEFNRTLQGLLDITARLFGLRYEEARDAQRWHPSVRVYEVFQETTRLGRIYLDLHPRPSKYKHAAQFPLVNGVLDAQLPEGALVCNFPDPAVQSPALMEHDDVVTLFHEFGHLMHHLLGGKATWASQSGVATEWDFVEAPSQMFEEWAWDVGTLQLFAKHVETGEPIPEALVKRMRAANEFGKGTWARTQAFYAELSRRYHTEDPETLNLQKTMEETQSRYSLFPYLPGTHFHTSFGHLNGYSAMYYTYLWSLVIAKDLLAEFKRHGLLDPATSHRYRDVVLARGGSKDAAELIQDFLGRPYGFEAFERWLNAS
jgi:thimet oligopeptidase